MSFLSDVYDLVTGRRVAKTEIYSKTESDNIIAALRIFFDFTTTSNPSYAEKRLFYDNVDKTLAVYNDIQGFTHNLGYEHVVRVRNHTESIIPDGKGVYISGIDTDNIPLVSLAKADLPSTAIFLGVTTTELAANGDAGDTGIVTQIGQVHELDTSSFPAFSRLYVSETAAGDFQTTEPVINSGVGLVLKSHATEGIILVNARPVSLKRKEYLFLVDYDTNYLTYRVKSVGGSGTQRFTFAVPDDFVSLNYVKLIGSISAGAAGSDKNIDLSSNYGKSGENDNQHAETNTTILYDFTGLSGKIADVDVSSVFSSLSAGDICGLQIDHNAIGGTINYFSIELDYIGYN